MSYWNYRVTKQLVGSHEWYAMREVRYNDDDTIYDYANYPGELYAISKELLHERMAQFNAGLAATVLNLDCAQIARSKHEGSPSYQEPL
jgi:hypothetical protein